MGVREDLLTLAEELRASNAVLRKISGFYKSFVAKPDASEQEPENAIILSDIFVNFYTCLETSFLRISQVFENSLDDARRHKDLLSKMTLSVKGIRERVISDASYKALGELLRFRQFKRYYFEFDYDWDRLELVRKKFVSVEDTVSVEL